MTNLDMNKSIGKISFPEGNKIVFSQDFGIWEGLPSNIEFDIYPLDNSCNGVKLVASGYGGKPYGNGAIYLHRGMNEKLQDS